MKAKVSRKSLDQFRMDKKNGACKICALPKEVTKQINVRSRHIIPLPVIIAWLKAEWGISITKEEWLFHNRAGHKWRKAKSHG
jgi:hypothetical protein